MKHALVVRIYVVLSLGALREKITSANYSSTRVINHIDMCSWSFRRPGFWDNIAKKTIGMGFLSDFLDVEALRLESVRMILAPTRPFTASGASKTSQIPGYWHFFHKH